MRKGRSVKPAERPTYDACHALMLAGTIYTWSIDNDSGRWTVNTAPSCAPVTDGTTADVAALVAELAAEHGIDARYLSIVAGRDSERRAALQRAVDGTRKPRAASGPSELARLRARVAELESLLAARELVAA